VKSRERRLLSAIRSSMCVSTLSSLAIAVFMISRLLAYSTSSNGRARPVSLA
jgi:hypothetical protein